MNRQQLWTIVAALGWLVYFALTLAVPTSLEPQLWPQLFSLLFGLLLLEALLLAGERPRWPAGSRWVMFAAGLVLVVGPYLLNANSPMIRAFVALGLMLVALPLGYWIGDRMEKATNLIPLAIGMSAADVYSVFMGPSRQVAERVVEHQEQVAQVIEQLAPSQGAAAAAHAAAQLRAPLGDFIIVHLPLAGTGTSIPVLGIGDFIILAFLFRAAWVHRISPRLVFWSAFLSTVAALALSNILNMPLPALPFIALGTVGTLCVFQPRLRRLSRQEITLSVLVVAAFVGLLAYKWLSSLLLPG